MLPGRFDSRLVLAWQLVMQKKIGTIRERARSLEPCYNSPSILSLSSLMAFLRLRSSLLPG